MVLELHHMVIRTDSDRVRLRISLTKKTSAIMDRVWKKLPVTRCRATHAHTQIVKFRENAGVVLDLLCNARLSVLNECIDKLVDCE